MLSFSFIAISLMLFTCNGIRRIPGRSFKMSADYYVEKNLYVYYNNDRAYSIINLSRENGYLYNVYDENVTDYHKKMDDYVKLKLKPDFEPIDIYSDSVFKNTLYERKYRNFIQSELNAEYKEWKDVDKVNKVEDRYLNNW